MRTQPLCRTRNLINLLLIISTCALAESPAAAASLPAGFTETLVAGGLSAPTAMQFAPDGRLFVCEQGGRLRVVKDGTLLPTPFLTLTVSSAGERGLLGVAFDPGFATNHFPSSYLNNSNSTFSPPWM